MTQQTRLLTQKRPQNSGEERLGSHGRLVGQLSVAASLYSLSLMHHISVGDEWGVENLEHVWCRVVNGSNTVGVNNERGDVDLSAPLLLQHGLPGVHRGDVKDREARICTYLGRICLSLLVVGEDQRLAITMKHIDRQHKARLMSCEKQSIVSSEDGEQSLCGTINVCRHNTIKLIGTSRRRP
eukprot:gene34670-42763_t